MAKPSDETNPDCLPCLFLQFPVRENGARVYKILQVFSRQVLSLFLYKFYYEIVFFFIKNLYIFQAIMMDTLISGFVGESNLNGTSTDIANANRTQDNTVIPNVGHFTNKLSKFTLATFDEEGNEIL